MKFFLVSCLFFLLAGCSTPQAPIPPTPRGTAVSFSQINTPLVTAPATPTATNLPRRTRRPTPTQTPILQLNFHPNVRIAAEFNPVESALPAWSPDGKQVVFVDRSHQLMIANAPDFAVRKFPLSPQVANTGWGEPYVYWQPNGVQFLFASLRNDTVNIMSNDGSDARDLLPGWRAKFNGPSFAKRVVGWLDEQTLLFSAHCGSGCEEPFLIQLPDGALYFLPATFGPAFTVDIHTPWIIVLGNSFDLRLIHRNMGIRIDTPEQLSSAELYSTSPTISRTLALPPPIRFHSWSADRTQLYVTAYPAGWDAPANAMPDLYAWNVEANQIERVFSNVRTANESPDGKYLVLHIAGTPRVENGRFGGTDYQPSNSVTLYTVVLDRATQELVKMFKGATISDQDAQEVRSKVLSEGRYTPVVSTRGRYIGYWDAEGEFWLYDLVQNNEIPITTGSGEFLKRIERLNIGFSPDDRYLVMASSRGNTRGARLMVLEIPRKP